MWNLKWNGTNELIYKMKQTHRSREWTHGYQYGKVGGRDSWEVWDWHVHTAIFKLDNQQGPTVYHRDLCSILCNKLNGKKIRKRIDHFAVHPKLTQQS